MTIKTNSLSAWILASRPKTLGAICCPVLIGSSFALADGHFKPIYFLTTLLCSLFLQILANFVNDYGDFIKGSDKEDRLGPPRAMQMGLISHGAMLKGIVLVLLLAIALGLLLVAQAGLPIFITGAFCIFLCLWYTLGPKPLAYLGFAEIAILLVFGPLATLGSYYVHSSMLSWPLFFASFSPGFLSAALLLTNNLRDVVQDQKNHKRTIAVRCGARFARVAIFGLLVLSTSSPLILVISFSYSPLLLLSLLALLLPARHLGLILFEPISARFNLMLASVGQSLYLLGLLMSLGIIYGAP